MASIKRAASSLSLAEPHVDIAAHTFLTSHPQKHGWLRYKKKSLGVLSNFTLFNHHLSRFFRWPNRYIILTTDEVHVYKTEYRMKTERTLQLKDVERLTTYADTRLHNYCIEFILKNNMNTNILPFILAAPSKIDQDDWVEKIKENIKSHNDGSSNQAEYDKIDSIPPYTGIQLSDEDFVEHVITYRKSKQDLAELFNTCAKGGDYVIRRSRTKYNAVLSVYDGTALKEFIIMRPENRLTLNQKVFFEDINELLEYYENCTLPRTKSLKLTQHLNTFQPIKE